MIAIVGYGTVTGMKSGTHTTCLVGECSQCGHNLIIEKDMKCMDENCECDCEAYLAQTKRDHYDSWRNVPCSQIN